MTSFLQKFKASQLKAKTYKLTKGMTYIELIVVLSIFSVLSAVSIYSYNSFQGNVDVKNVASDIALKIVQAQKDASFGKLPSRSIPNPTTWKPRYAVHFDRNNPGIGDTAFMYFVDLDGDFSFDYGPLSFNGSDCTGSGECLEKINLTKGNKIVNIKGTIGALGPWGPGPSCDDIPALSIVYTRPSQAPFMGTNPAWCSGAFTAEITVISPKGNTAKITVDPSGRVNIN